MDLADFVTNALVQIQTGVANAIDQRSDKAGVISPLSNSKIITKGEIQIVEFDVAVTASDKTDVDGHAGIKVLSLNIGGGGSTSSQLSTVSRMRFSVPVILPNGKLPKDTLINTSRSSV
ncbi:hypothetical protein [Marinivivus vitaminiproducens]|uniref:hypothetical protein n=1 Tax=Marinivivus vitaminiproducens TaxID=3035935 RepID=UPI0027A48670|nr:hypothetical protein P4R82_23375 [Geminicoccaceae bacterium SCSIO 64248]